MIKSIISVNTLDEREVHKMKTDIKTIALDFAMLLGVFAAVFLGGMISFSDSAQAVTAEVLRLHIPANSDSADDQRIKLQLRDALLEEYGALLSESGSLPEAEKRAEELLPEIEQFCCGFLKENGANYSARAEITEMYFTTREYERVTLPAGRYKALRITLGSGEGHNWWCIMFPPLCLPCAEAPEEPADISEDSALAKFECGGITIRFAIYEWIMGLIGEC